MQFILAGGVIWAVIKVLTAFGIGIITFTTVKASFDFLVVEIQSSYGGLPGDMLQIFGLYSIHEALGIVLGAMVVRASLVFLSKIGVLPS
jgi:hypothetical protein